MSQSQEPDRPTPVSAAVHQADAAVQASRLVAQTAFNQLVDLNRARGAAWISGLEARQRAALERQRAHLDAARRILQTTAQANRALVREWLVATERVKAALLEGQASVLDRACEQRRAIVQRWAEVARQVTEAPRQAAESTALAADEAAAQRVLEGPVDELEKLIRDMDAPARLEALERVERAGRQRTTVQEAIRARRGVLQASTRAAA